MIRFATIMIALLLLLVLPGCSTLGSVTQAVGIDTFCLQKKRSWSLDDSPQTIREARIFNETMDRRCGSKTS